MGNSHSYTLKYVAVKAKLEAATKPLRSAKARREAIQRAVTMPNSLPPLARRAVLMQGGSGE